MLPEDWPFLLFVAAGFLFVPLMLWRAHRKVQQWEAMAPELGLRPLGERRLAGWEARTLVGQQGRFPVQLRTYTTGTGKSRTTWSTVEVAAPEADPAFTLRLTKEGLGSALAKALGGQDVEVGNPSFDERFRLRASHPDRAPRAVDATVQALLEALPLPGEVRVEPGLPLPDGSHAPADGLDALRAFAGRRGPEAQPLLQAPAGDAERVVLVRWVRQGLVVDAEAHRATLQALVRLAEGVTTAAPRGSLR